MVAVIMSEMDPTAPSEMRLRPEKVIKRIPGQLPPIPSRDKEAFVDQLSSKSIADLKELLERQQKVLSNKFLLSKLKDQGAKAAELRDKIEKELQSRSDVDGATNLLAEMSLGQLTALEWTGHCSPGYLGSTKISHVVDDEREETDPLKIFASHSSITHNQKQLRVLKAEEGFITPRDLAEIESSVRAQPTISTSLEVDSKCVKPSTSSSLDDPEPFAHFICNRFGHKEIKDRFKPNKPLKPFTGVFPIQPPGRVTAKINRSEETNVTPPLSVYGDAKLLTLEESIELQRHQAQKLKNVQLKHAAEKLSSLHGLSLVGDLPTAVCLSMAHRRGGESISDSDEDIHEADLEDQELHDEDQQDRGGTVVYNIEA